MKTRWQRSHQEPSEGKFFVESSRTLQSKQVCSPLNMVLCFDPKAQEAFGVKPLQRRSVVSEGTRQESGLIGDGSRQAWSADEFLGCRR
jgi:hypothetical protein